MNPRQQDQHYVITGGGTGIGKAIALRLASEGAKITVIARTESKLQAVVSEIQHQGGIAQYRTCDIGVQSEVEQVISEAVESFGPLRGVIANSGVGGANFPDPMIDLTSHPNQLEWDLLHPEVSTSLSGKR